MGPRTPTARGPRLLQHALCFRLKVKVQLFSGLSLRTVVVEHTGRQPPSTPRMLVAVAGSRPHPQELLRGQLAWSHARTEPRPRRLWAEFSLGRWSPVETPAFAVSIPTGALAAARMEGLGGVRVVGVAAA